MARRFLQTYRTPLTAMGGAFLAVAVMMLYLELAPPGGRYSDDDIQRLADERISEITPTPPIEPEIYAAMRPSVVLISRGPFSPNGSPTSGLGSGVVVSDKGEILTANHVVEGRDIVSVRFFDGTIMTALVSQRQPEKDLALLTMQQQLPNGVGPATLAGGVREGEQVMAIGSPFGLEGSFSSGIVSGLNRFFSDRESGVSLSGLIQFDAAVNPGNSGGPLVNRAGHVVGIVTGLVNPSEQTFFIGIGFAVPLEQSTGILPPLG